MPSAGGEDGKDTNNQCTYAYLLKRQMEAYVQGVARNIRISQHGTDILDLAKLCKELISQELGKDALVC
jgi:hypothetical protein